MQQGNNSLIMWLWTIGSIHMEKISYPVHWFPIFVTPHYNVCSVSSFGIKLWIIFSPPEFNLLWKASRELNIFTTLCMGVDWILNHICCSYIITIDKWTSFLHTLQGGQVFPFRLRCDFIFSKTAPLSATVPISIQRLLRKWITLHMWG